MFSRKYRVLLIHNILWSHYKAVVFSCLAKKCKEHSVDFMVLQTALYGKGQKKLSNVDWSLHDYSFKLAFESGWEETTLSGRFRAYVSEINNFNPDVVVLPGYIDKAIWGLTGWLVAKGVPIVQVVDSTLADHRRVWWKEAVKRTLLGPVKLVFCYGTSQRAYLNTLGVADSKIRIRLQATNNTLYRKEFAKVAQAKSPDQLARAYNLLFVGRLAPEKNLPLLINALRSLPESFNLTIVGAGPEEEALKALANDDRLRTRVVFAGNGDWNEMVTYYANADVFVLPSWSEPWGLVINEAMLCELPVVISNRCGGAADLVVENKNGYTFDPISEPQLRTALINVYEKLMNGEKMGKASAEIISYYTPERSADQMLSGLLELRDE